MGRRRKRLPAEPVTAEIHDLSHDGRGVTRVNDKVTFVHGALPGETVQLRLIGRRKDFDLGEVVQVEQPSPHRVEPLCANFGRCGGCALQHLAPAEQIAAKQNVLKENLRRIAELEPDSWLEPITGDPFGYRRKARLSVRNVVGKGRVLVGFRERNGRYVCDMVSCETLVSEVGQHLDVISACVGRLSVPDAIPQIEVAAGDEGRVLVIRHLEPLNEQDHTELAELGRELNSTIWLQPGGLDSLHRLDGASLDDAPLTFALPDFGLTFEFSPLNFVQVNAEMNQRMVAHAIEQLDLAPEHRLLDLFCGLGNFTLPAARHCGEAVGVEGEPALVALAERNAERNQIRNAKFFAADLTESVAATPWAQLVFDRVLLDPPRSGAAEMIPLLDRLAAPRIVYVSCHPGSLARDAGLLAAVGYRLVTAGVLDMFPQTAHVESLAVFERGSA